MSNKISRRTFLKCTGASAAAMGAASLLGGCSSNGNNTSVEVKVGDTISNWNNLLVSFTGLFRMNLELGIEG
ncbi:MAG: twin-arginine translocation signal domain-containing protein, partial [Faecalibacterium sp.]